MVKNVGKPRNYQLRRGLMRYTRAQMKQRACVFKHKAHLAAMKAKHAEARKAAPVAKKTERIPTANEVLPLSGSATKSKVVAPVNAPRLPKTLVPGTVLIMLAGRYYGRRVVFLKTLPSGLLLVTGPYKVNGIPLRRVSKAYVMQTSTVLDVKDIKIDESVVNDTIFAKPHLHKGCKSERDFFKAEPHSKRMKRAYEKQVHAVPEARKQAQKAIDAQLLPAIKKVPKLRDYLVARFQLSKSMRPHLLKF